MGVSPAGDGRVTREQVDTGLMVTLHAYVLRDLLKTLGLTVAALTVLFTMGGGLYNVVRYEGVSAGDVLRFIPLLVPIVVTLTLPVATLFAVTQVYGRLAADNELTACRAAGINVHRLLWPGVLLSLGVAAFSLLIGNFVIPELAGQLTNFARNNLRDMVAQHLQAEGFVQHTEKRSGDRYTLTAERVQGVAESALREKSFESGPGLQYLLVTNPTFLHVDGGGKLLRFTVARYGLCLFDIRPTPVELTIFVSEGRDLEVGKRAVYVAEQQIGPLGIPMPSPFRLSAANLSYLLRWRKVPWESPKLREEVSKFLAGLAQERFYDFCSDRLERHPPLLLADGRGGEYRLTAGGVRRDNKGLSLQGGRVEAWTADRQMSVAYEAEQVELRARLMPSGQPLVELNLVRTPRQDVLEYRRVGSRAEEPRHKPTLSLDGAQVPDAVLAEASRITPAMILSDEAITAGQVLSDKRLGLQKAAAELLRKIDATIHFRLSYACSILVTGLMGAALGIIFRGSRALVAFALSMIPFFSVLILMVLGRQLTEAPQTTAIGPAVTWGGLLLVLATDLAVLRIGVRR